jgi:hypothetical protein
MSDNMPLSIRALITRLIDYAGLFPPAKLEMAAAVKNYADYVSSDEAWMMGRLIVPVARLAEFEQHAAALVPKTAQDEPDLWQISALTSAAGSDQLAIDLTAIEEFNLLHEKPKSGRVIVDAIELKADTPEAIDAAMELISDDLYPFFEIAIDRDLAGMIDMLAEVEAAAKVRTGGVTADLYPVPADLARFIAACAAANVPFKATAGMHHPLRHQSDAMGAKEFGFLNVFIAGCLALTSELEEDELREILEVQSIEDFVIDDDGIAWRDHQIETASIEDVRLEFAMSFGSCSFDEPREGLNALGLS